MQENDSSVHFRRRHVLIQVLLVRDEFLTVLTTFDLAFDKHVAVNSRNTNLSNNIFLEKKRLRTLFYFLNKSYIFIPPNKTKNVEEISNYNNAISDRYLARNLHITLIRTKKPNIRIRHVFQYFMDMQ